MAPEWKTGSYHEKYGLAWHKEDENMPNLTDGDNVTSSLKKANAYDIEVVKAPMFIHVGEHVIESDKTQLVMTNVPWMDNGIQLLDRQVSWYEPIQNREYAEILDGLTENYKMAGVTMCGTHGEMLAIQMQMPDFEIGGMEQEQYKSYMLIAEDRKSGLKLFGTVNTRVVCQNTFNAAISEKGDKSLPNSLNARSVLELRTQIEHKVIENRQSFIASMNNMFKTPMHIEEMISLGMELFPVPKKPKMVELLEQATAVLDTDQISETMQKKGYRANQLYENAMERADKHAKALMTSFHQFNDEHTYAANTAYAAFNAVTDHFNHSPLFKSEGDVEEYNLLFGTKAKAQVQAYALLNK